MISSLLKEERKRLNLTQADVALSAGVSRETWSRYESNKLMPGTEVLTAIAATGFDVQYLLTGVRSAMALAPDERLLLERYRSATKAGKEAILGAALGQKTFEQKYSGGVGQVVESIKSDVFHSTINMPVPKNKK